jgi:hypothetical protein
VLQLVTVLPVLVLLVTGMMMELPMVLPQVVMQVQLLAQVLPGEE